MASDANARANVCSFMQAFAKVDECVDVFRVFLSITNDEKRNVA